MATNNRSFLDDAESLRAIVEALPPGLRDEYDSYGALSAESCFPNRVMAVYTLRDGQPTDIELLRFGDITVTRIGGPVIEVSDGERTFDIGVTPVKWKDRDLFLQVPQNFVFKWKGKRVPGKGIQFVPHYAVLVKSLSREHVQAEGHTYCVTLNKFSERFPEVKARY